MMSLGRVKPVSGLFGLLQVSYVFWNLNKKRINQNQIVNYVHILNLFDLQIICTNHTFKSPKYLQKLALAADSVDA